MSKGTVNKVTLIGNLGADPDFRQFENGGAVANLRLATTESWTDRNGEAQTRTEWHSVAIYGKPAETAAKYLKKGSKVFIDGSIRSRPFQDKNGIDRIAFEIVANDFQMLDRVNGNAAPEQAAAPAAAAPAPAQAKPAAKKSAPAPEPVAAGVDGDFDDEIPF